MAPPRVAFYATKDTSILLVRCYEVRDQIEILDEVDAALDDTNVNLFCELLNELVEEVGPDVIRFMMLTQKPETPIDFDIKKAVEMSSDNPVFYVQYAHARICSLFRKINDENINFDIDLQSISPQLNNPGELNLIKKISIWPNVVISSATRNEPHKIVYYLQELANLFHSHWNQGLKNKEIRFIQDKDELLTKSRLLMCYAVSKVIANGLKLIGVEPLKEMR